MATSTDCPQSELQVTVVLLVTACFLNMNSAECCALAHKCGGGMFLVPWRVVVNNNKYHAYIKRGE